MKANWVKREMHLIVFYRLIYNILCVMLLTNYSKEDTVLEKKRATIFSTVDGRSYC